jgi:hypothetical protein
MEKGYYDYYSAEELKEKNTYYADTFKETEQVISLEEKLENPAEDRLKANIWDQAYKIASYYYDNPTVGDRYLTLKKFKFHFKNLLNDTKDGNELPDLRSKDNFVLWVCKKHNEYLDKAGEKVRVDCNLNKLKENYGPHYKSVRGFIGEFEYFL